MCYSGGSHPATAMRANRMVMMVFLFMFISFYLWKTTPIM